MILQIGKIISNLYGINEKTVEDVVKKAKEIGTKTGDQMISLGFITEKELYRALSEQFSLEFIESAEEMVDTDLLREISTDLFKEGKCLPLEGGDGDVIKLMIDDPLDLDTLQMVELLTGLPVSIYLTTKTEMKRLNKIFFDNETLFQQSAIKIAKEYEKKNVPEESLTIEEIRRRTESEPVVKMASLIIEEGIKLGASDIHIEPSEHHATVRMRIDGLLRKHTEISRWLFSPLTSRIKILADLDIAEKRIPQDGRIRYVFENQPYDLRVSTLPTHFGEKTVIRILKHDHSLLDIKNIGLTDEHRRILEELIERPQGMIFVTGPTGSGKSSTLFACLNRISHKAINITTIENPIEYKLEGINQVQINEKAGVTFASALRSILRQDPDVILVGEIRDTETAKIAVQAAQTGHLVLSTLHTNDSLSAITRMRDLEVPSFLIASSLLAVVAQRLVRVLCPFCKHEAKNVDSLQKRWESMLPSYEFPGGFMADGCSKCNGIGFKGRTAIFEIVVVNDKIREMITENLSDTIIRKKLREDGFKSLIQDGIDKVKNGVTSVEELLRIVQLEDIL